MGGSPGIGPRVIDHATPVPGGTPGSQVVVLGDRALTITAVTRQSSSNQNVTGIHVDLAVENSSASVIQNQPTFFQLTGAEGDTFAARTNGADPFFTAIEPRTTHRGSVDFEVPGATTSGLHLLYRPELAAEAVIVPLSIAR
jgi:hypothetical protein